MNRALRRCLLVAAAAPAAGLLLAALAPTGWWPTPLARHWAPQLAVCCLPLWCWLGRRPAPGIFLCLLATAALWPAFLAAHAHRAMTPGSDAATACVANLLYKNSDHRPALTAVDGDLAVLIETLPEDRAIILTDPRWSEQRWLTPRGYGGMALLSRWPMHSREIDLAGAPAIDAHIQAPWGELRVIAIHTWSPSRPHRAERNRQQLAELAALAITEPGPLLVLGDLNASPGDPGMQDLRDAGLLPPANDEPATWPWFLGPCGITIDHALVRQLALGEAQAISLPGSDHRGVRVRFGALPRNADAR